MLISYDPDGKSQITEELIEKCKRLGLNLVNVICDEPSARVGDQTGVSFVAMAAFAPRQGDRIRLEDGRLCEVKKVAFQVVTNRDSEGKAESILLMPNVIAHLLHEKE